MLVVYPAACSEQYTYDIIHPSSHNLRLTSQGWFICKQFEWPKLFSMVLNTLLFMPRKCRCNVSPTIQTIRHTASPPSRLGSRSHLKCPTSVIGELLKKHSSKGSVARFDLMNLAPQRYQGLQGDILPVKSFVVPYKTEIWPQSSLVDGEFGRTGFDINLRSIRKKPFYDTVISALLEYRRLYLDLHVPFRFVVPNDSDAWPKCAWRLHLGVIVRKIRKGVFYKSKRIELESMGFDYRPCKTRTYRTLKVALLRYKELYGDMLVPTGFKVPDESTVWPASVLGYRLGRAVISIRGGRNYVSRRDELESIGFDYTHSNDRSYQSMKLCLLRYKELYGDMLVPCDFKVPDESTAWPASVLGYRLGDAVHGIRGGSNYASRRDDLESIGFDYTHSNDRS